MQPRLITDDTALAVAFACGSSWTFLFTFLKTTINETVSD